jgi:hypothetical protein
VPWFDYHIGGIFVIFSNTKRNILIMQAAKKHLTQRIEKLDDKLDQQKALSGQIKDDVLSP